MPAPVLREIRKTRQVEGEPPRKWYFAREFDLVVWFDPEGRPAAFQLAYDKHRDEQSVAWSAERGYRHYVVETGRRAGTPLLAPGGRFPRDRVLTAFRAQAEELPLEVVDFVIGRLRDYDGPLLETAENEALRMQRALERLGFNDPEDAAR
ncbi:MAG: hypothetical protein JNM32_06845 [Dechloromonas sp.]|nr:hypothetical protein [Dechloromonas sp.]